VPTTGNDGTGRLLSIVVAGIAVVAGGCLVVVARHRHADPPA
jgi:hypothetical protein